MSLNPFAQDRVSDTTLREAGTLLEAGGFKAGDTQIDTALDFAEMQAGTRDRVELAKRIPDPLHERILQGLGSGIGSLFGSTLRGLLSSVGGLILLGAILLLAFFAIGGDIEQLQS